MKKIISTVCTAALLFSMVAANAATQVGTTYNYTGTDNKPSGNDNTLITPYLDEEHWIVPESGTRGVATRQNTVMLDGTSGEGFGSAFTGASNSFTFNNGLTDADIIYYVFDFLCADSGGAYALNGYRLDGKSDTNIALLTDANGYVKNHPYKITVIADKNNQKAYYYSYEAEKGTYVEVATTLADEATTLTLGNTANGNKRYFFKNFAYGTLDYAVAGADTITAGASEVYSISETGTADDNVNFVPENLTLTCDTEGVTITDNATVSVDAAVADNTVITLSAKINGTVVATKDVTVSASAGTDEPQIQDTAVYGSTEDEIGFVAEFTAENAVTDLTWYIKKTGGEYKELPIDGVLPTIASGSTVKIGLLVSGFANVASADELSAGYVVE